MRKRLVPGKKGFGDLKLEIDTEGEWYCMPFYDLLHIIQFCMENEDRIYPPPASGREMLQDAILDLFDGIPIDNIAADSDLKGGILF